MCTESILVQGKKIHKEITIYFNVNIVIKKGRHLNNIGIYVKIGLLALIIFFLRSISSTFIILLGFTHSWNRNNPSLITERVTFGSFFFNLFFNKSS